MIHYVQNSFALIEALRPLAFDHVITDPPYSEHVQANMMSGTTLAKVNLGFAHVSSYAFVRTLRDVARRWALVFCAIEAFGEIQKVAGEKSYARSAIWYKANSMGQLTGDRPANACEGIAVLHAPGLKKRWNAHGAYGFYACNGTRGEPDRHPNQKPLDLCLRLVASFTDRGETVFDPFAGSGRIGEACKMLGREYVGFDFDPSWVEKGNARIAAVQSQMTDESAMALCRARKADMV